jgi:hypothetical protein
MICGKQPVVLFSYVVMRTCYRKRHESANKLIDQLGKQKEPSPSSQFVKSNDLTTALLS